MTFQRNAAWNIAEIIVSVSVQLIIVRIIVHALGLSALGVWSLVFAALSVARAADVGLGGGLVRFVALPQDQYQPGITRMHYVETALVGNAILYSALSFLMFIPAHYAIGLVLKSASVDQAYALLPYALLSFVTTNLSSVTSSALIGFNRSGIKSMLTIIMTVSYLGLAIMLVHKKGLIGLAEAQLAKGVALVAAGWIASLRISGSKTRWALPHCIDMRVLKEMLGLGVRIQGLNIANFLYDPAIRFILSATAGPAAVGMYEACYRFVSQVRNVIVIPTWNMAPLFASMQPDDVEARSALYARAVSMVSLVGLAGAVAAIAASPLASLVILGDVRLRYIVWTAILSLGWYFYIIGIPAYVMNVGRGIILWSAIAAATSVAVGAMLGFSLGYVFGGTGITIAAAVAIAMSGIVSAIGNTRQAGIANPFPTAQGLREAAGLLRERLSATPVKFG